MTNNERPELTDELKQELEILKAIVTRPTVGMLQSGGLCFLDSNGSARPFSADAILPILKYLFALAPAAPQLSAEIVLAYIMKTWGLNAYLAAVSADKHKRPVAAVEPETPPMNTEPVDTESEDRPKYRVRKGYDKAYRAANEIIAPWEEQGHLYMYRAKGIGPWLPAKNLAECMKDGAHNSYWSLESSQARWALMEQAGYDFSNDEVQPPASAWHRKEAELAAMNTNSDAPAPEPAPVDERRAEFLRLAKENLRLADAYSIAFYKEHGSSDPIFVASFQDLIAWVAAAPVLSEGEKALREAQIELADAYEAWINASGLENRAADKNLSKKFEAVRALRLQAVEPTPPTPAEMLEEEKQVKRQEVQGYFKLKKSPVGIEPEWAWRERRVQTLCETVKRYLEAGRFEPAVKWIAECTEHTEWLNARKAAQAVADGRLKEQGS